MTPDDLGKISWEQFEALCGFLLAQEVNASDKWLTQIGSDYGADAVIFSNEAGYLIQCKHTKNAGYDGHKAVMEVQTAKTRYENSLKRKISHLIFMTNAKQLSVKTRKIAKEYGVEVMDYSRLCQLLDAHKTTFKQLLIFLKAKRLKAD